MRQINIRVSDEIYREFRRYCLDGDWKMAEILRRYIEVLCEEHRETGKVREARQVGGYTLLEIESDRDEKKHYEINPDPDTW